MPLHRLICPDSGRALWPHWEVYIIKKENSNPPRNMCQDIFGYPRQNGRGPESWQTAMTLREMTVEDLDQVMEIENALFSVPWSREGFFTYLIKDRSLFLVVEEKGRILGYCGLVYVLDEGEITNVAVREDRQREGIGHFMVDGMLRFAVELKLNVLYLEVRAGNGTAIRLYERLGFEKNGLRKNYYTDPTEDAILMACRLPSGQ